MQLWTSRLLLKTHVLKHIYISSPLNTENCITRFWRRAWRPTRGLALVTYNARKNWRNEIEWTGKVNIRKREIPGSSWSMQDYSDQLQVLKTSNTAVFSAEGILISASTVPDCGSQAWNLQSILSGHVENLQHTPTGNVSQRISHCQSWVDQQRNKNHTPATVACSLFLTWPLFIKCWLWQTSNALV